MKQVNIVYATKNLLKLIDVRNAKYNTSLLLVSLAEYPSVELP